ncbi:MAG: YfhO family protein [Anaerolineae bacterium]|nr:YfhO family protein [Anaerolineae bacterium]
MRRLLSRHGRDLLALTTIALAVSLFHARGLKPGYTFLPVDLVQTLIPWQQQPEVQLQNPLIGDPLSQFYPFLSFAIASLKAGQWPLWNPFIFLGHPALADPLAQTFYPIFSLIGVITGAARAIVVGLWLHAVLAGGLMYGFLRSLRCGRLPALLGALTYVLSGYMVTWFETLFWTSTLAWLPGVLWAAEMAIQRRRFRAVGLAGLAFGLALLAGQFQFAFAFAAFLALYLLGRGLELRGSAPHALLWSATTFGLTVATGVLVASIQLAPFLEYLPQTNRAPGSSFDPLPAEQLFTLVVPNFFGNPATIRDFWGGLNYSEGTIYVGLVALLLAVMAPFVSRRRFLAAYLLGIAVLIMYFAVGGPGVNALHTLPGIEFFSLHRTLFLLPLLLGTLAALTLDSSGIPRAAPFLAGGLLAGLGVAAYALNWGGVQDHLTAVQPEIVRAAWVLALAVGLVAIGAQHGRIRSWAATALVILVFVDLYLIGGSYNPTGPIDQLPAPTPAIEFMQQNAGQHRVAPLLRIAGIPLGPNLVSLFGLSEGGGYSSVAPIGLSRLFEYGDPQAKAWNILALSQPTLNLIDLLQVRYAILGQPMDDPGLHVEHLVEGCNQASEEISASHSITGTFQVANSALNRLDLTFSVPAPQMQQGELQVRLWQGTDREQLVLEAQQEAAGLQDQQKVTWYFSPEQDAPGQSYLWEVSTAATATGVALCESPAGEPAVAAYGIDWGEPYAGEAYIHERLAPMPRAYVVYAAVRELDRRITAQLITGDGFDLRNTVASYEALGLPDTAPRPATPARIVSYQPTSVVIEASAETDGVLVLGDQYHPGWQATVDGQPAPILPVNVALRGVLLPAGEHRVEFRFAPASLRTGAALSLLGLLLALVLLTVDRVRRRRQPN